jgi:pimeloyl-ACP methyl ester carboxylesterase
LNPGQFPAVILVSGSGPQDRNGDTGSIPQHGPFTQIAEHLARHGFAILRYDDRGYGESTGDYGSSTEDDFIADAAAGLAFLRERNDIARARVGFIGHSEGSLIAASVARTNPNVAFVISLAGGALKGFDLLLEQAEMQARAIGMSEDEVTEIIRQQSIILTLVMEQDWEGLAPVIKETVLTRIEALPDEQKAALGDLDAFASQRATRAIHTFGHPRYQFMLNHDFGEDWESISVPVLGVFGELDVQANATKNAEALKLRCAKSGNTDVTTIILPDANHFFVKTRTGSMTEYATMDKDFVPEFLPTISDWLAEQMGGE